MVFIHKKIGSQLTKNDPLHWYSYFLPELELSFLVAWGSKGDGFNNYILCVSAMVGEWHQNVCWTVGQVGA